MWKTKINLTGKRFGRLLAFRDTLQRENGHVLWLCQCDCGNYTKVVSSKLINGHTKSCGCLQKEKAKLTCLQKERLGNLNPNFKHGDKIKGKESRLYKSWRNIKTRCLNLSDPHYKWYGGKGITVCKEWKNSYIEFRDWAMANGYADDLTIDRINHRGNYEPSNCQWVSRSDNAKKANKNRRRSKNE